MQDYKVVSQRHLRAGMLAGYDVEERLIAEGTNHSFTMKVALTPTGDYIGDPKFAYRLCKKRGIVPQLSSPSDKVCSIGFCPSERKWYGWSHRAICGFGIGSVAKEGDSCTTSGFVDEYRDAHPELDKRVPVGFEAKTLEDAKKMAIAFAESVS